jgi:outer membrane protein OmpA-like peptidoglycan-associated protein
MNAARFTMLQREPCILALTVAMDWVDTIHLPMPVNSTYDEYYFSTFKNGVEGFFSSNRPGSLTMDNGSCCDDIFYYKVNDCVKVHAIGKVLNHVNYDFYDMLNAKYNMGLTYPENNLPLANVPVELYVLEKSTDNEILLQQTQTTANGTYAFDLERNKKYKVLIKNYGYFDKKIDLSTLYADCADTIKAKDTKISYLPKINVRINIYFEHDKARLSFEAKRTIDTTLVPIFEMFPNSVIEIGSHTDDTGTDEYNINLSQRRSESVVEYLTEKGIAPERLVAKGYGESMPIAPNTKPDGSDYPEGRQLNRRTELRIIGEVNTFNIDE